MSKQYRVKVRSGLYVRFTNRRAAEKCARDERKDGWPSKVENC